MRTVAAVRSLASPEAPKDVRAAPVPASRARRSLGPTLLLFLLVANIAVVTGLWLQHGGWPGDGSRATVFTAVGQITALWGTLAALVQILLVARVPGLDGRFGMDRLVRWHRWVGFSLAWFLLAHVIASTIGWAAGDGRGAISEFLFLNGHETSILLATVGFTLLVAVAVTSARASRRALSREAWFMIHLLSYVMMTVSFPHLVEVGTDFDHHRWTTSYWVLLYAVVVAALLWHRFGNPVRNTRRHRFVVGSTTAEAPGVISLRLHAHALDRFPLRAGQFVTVRFLARGWLHRAHPFSVSGQNGDVLRLTVKALGDDTAKIADIPVGTRVIVEGPYGAFTEAARTRTKVLLIAGGIGITPIRLLFERLAGERGDLTLLYRSSSAADVVFRDELDAIAHQRGCDVHYIVGPRSHHRDVFSASSLTSLVPDVASHDVYLCGPRSLVASATAGLVGAGVAPSRIHSEHFAL